MRSEERIADFVPEEQSVINHLRELSRQIIAFDLDKLLQLDMGQFSFRVYKPVFERVGDLFNAIAEADLEGIPGETLQGMTSTAVNVMSAYREIVAYSDKPQGTDFYGLRDRLIAQGKSYFYQGLAAAAPILAFDMAYRQSNLETVETEAKQKLEQWEQRARSRMEETEAIKQSAQEAAGLTAVAEHATFFEKEAKDADKHSYLWLRAAIALAIATVAYTIVSLEWHLGVVAATASIPRIIQLSVARGALASILITLTVICARNFSAARHNYVVNRHRLNALKTFEAFVKGSSDPEIQNAILLQAAQSVFAPQPTGYAKDEGEGQPNSQIIEIVRGLAGYKMKD